MEGEQFFHACEAAEKNSGNSPRRHFAVIFRVCKSCSWTCADDDFEHVDSTASKRTIADSGDTKVQRFKRRTGTRGILLDSPHRQGDWKIATGSLATTEVRAR